jgi:hypothetical protein
VTLEFNGRPVVCRARAAAPHHQYASTALSVRFPCSRSSAGAKIAAMSPCREMNTSLASLPASATLFAQPQPSPHRTPLPGPSIDDCAARRGDDHTGQHRRRRLARMGCALPPGTGRAASSQSESLPRSCLRYYLDYLGAMDLPLYRLSFKLKWSAVHPSQFESQAVMIGLCT